MKQLYLYLWLLLPVRLAAQGSLAFDTSAINHKSKLVGLYRTPQAYERADFIIDNPDEIKALIPTFTAGPETPLQTARNFYTITLLHDGKEIKTWTVDMSRNRLLSDGSSYQFDALTVRKLAKENPLKVRAVRKKFRTTEEADDYLKKAKLERRLLYVETPWRAYEGSFDLRIPRTTANYNILMAYRIVTNTLLTIAPRDSFDIEVNYRRYSPSNQDYHNFIISCKKSDYDQLNIKDWEKSGWTKLQIAATLYYRKY